MLIAFFDAEGVIHREFVPAGQRVNAEFYVGVLDWLLKRIRRVRTAKFQSSEWFLLHDNAPSHNAAVVKRFLANRNVAVLHHPPYSPDLASADYFLFPQVKIFPKRAAFSNSGRNSVCSGKGTKQHFKNCSPGGHEKFEGTCIQTYWSRRNVFWRLKINHVHIRSCLCFITVVYKLLGLTLYCTLPAKKSGIKYVQHLRCSTVNRPFTLDKGTVGQIYKKLPLMTSPVDSYKHSYIHEWSGTSCTTCDCSPDNKHGHNNLVVHHL